MLSKAGAINLPCCYHKLSLTDCNLSALAKKHPLAWGLYALTLASGAHHKVSLKDVTFRQQVKRFRYTLHFLLHDEFSSPGLNALGNCPPALYHGSFATYALEQLKRLGLTHQLTSGTLNAYYQDQARQGLIQQMLVAGLLRDMFGRPLEIALLIDRALWLEELGRQVELGEIFDSRISPRNLVMIVN